MQNRPISWAEVAHHAIQTEGDRLKLLIVGNHHQRQQEVVPGSHKDEQENSERAEYGKRLLKELSKKLTKEYGKGFSRSNLQNMRQFYLKYPICQTLSGKLNWSHYCEILSISDDKERAFYERIIIYALMKSK